MNNLFSSFRNFFIAAVCFAYANPTLAAEIHPLLATQLPATKPVNVILLMHKSERGKTLPFNLIEDYRIRRRWLVNDLRSEAEQTQSSLKIWLETHAIPYRSHWLVNMIEASLTASQIAQLQPWADIERIDPNSLLPTQLNSIATKQANEMMFVAWGIAKINVPQVWMAGIKGQGVVIAGQDSGFRWDHEALKAQYRGWNGIGVDHNFNWHDAIHDASAANVCGSNSPQPCDDHGHGTHTMGTMVGDNNLGNQIGVAPEAKWIGCRNMDVGAGTPARYIECMQWMLAPTDLNGLNPSPDLAPDIINNSWGCNAAEGCTLGNEIQAAVDTLVNTGIFFVVAAGNSGSNCNTILFPPAAYESVFVVGASAASDALANFSSRGPIPGNPLVRPDLIAPGVNIYSSFSSSVNAYGNNNGTSMAAPHVAGVAALLMSVNPALKGQPEKVAEILRTSTVTAGITNPINQNCGGIPSFVWPNYALGSGRVDAWAAFRMAETIFTDGFSN